MQMPTPTPFVQPLARSAGPVVPSDPSPRGYDPVQGGWIALDRPDDLDPASDDPLRQARDAMAAQGLGLRPWGRGDIAAFRALLDDAAVWAHLPEPYPDPLDEGGAEALIRLANGLDSHIVRAALAHGAPVGQVRLDLSPGGGTAELSYWLGRAHWGRGLGRRLVAGTVARAFSRMPGLLRLVAKVHPRNPASARVLERAGFAPCLAPAGPFAGWNWFALRRQHPRR